MSNFSLNNVQTRVEKVLETVLPKHSQLADAMRYSTLNGGKRLRAALIYASANDFHIALENVDKAAAAIECIHAYSLIHDDLPAMDNDAMRRGKASCHIAYGEATAILAGDGLNTLAFELLTKSTLPADIICKQVALLSHAAGPNGMVIGQTLDMNATGKAISLAQLQEIHRGKTGALLNAALHLGACPSKEYKYFESQLTKLGSAIGIAYQIIDDILDATKDTATLGKTAGKDAEQNKNTYLSHLSLAGSQAELTRYYEICSALLHELPQQAPSLQRLIKQIFSRQS